MIANNNIGQTHNHKADPDVESIPVPIKFAWNIAIFITTCQNSALLSRKPVSQQQQSRQMYMSD